jgi:hypothetical protein
VNSSSWSGNPIATSMMSCWYDPGRGKSSVIIAGNTFLIRGGLFFFWNVVSNYDKLEVLKREITVVVRIVMHEERGWASCCPACGECSASAMLPSPNRNVFCAPPIGKRHVLCAPTILSLRRPTAAAAWRRRLGGRCHSMPYT